MPNLIFGSNLCIKWLPHLGRISDASNKLDLTRQLFDSIKLNWIILWLVNIFLCIFRRMEYEREETFYWKHHYKLGAGGLRDGKTISERQNGLF